MVIKKLQINDIYFIKMVTIKNKMSGGIERVIFVKV